MERAQELIVRKLKLQREVRVINFELTAEPENYELGNKVWKWLNREDLTYDAALYSQRSWDDERREEYGRGALFTITTEGPLNQLLNYPQGKAAYDLIEKFEKYVRRLGIYYEMGYSWSLHFYPDEPPARIPPD
jgi:hypothetical protein